MQRERAREREREREREEGRERGREREREEGRERGREREGGRKRERERAKDSAFTKPATIQVRVPSLLSRRAAGGAVPGVRLMAFHLKARARIWP